MKRTAPHIYLISEFYSADGLVHSKFLPDAVLPHQTTEDPLVIQIFGKDPENFAKAAKIIENPKYNIAGIDVNMGCPAKKVCNKAAGSALLKDEALVREILESVVSSVSVPVTLKIRTGWSQDQKNGLAIAKIKMQSAAILNAGKIGFSFATIDCSALNPLTLGMVKVAAFLFRFKTYQRITKGISMNNQKKAGL